jgi:hypothetical protein
VNTFKLDVQGLPVGSIFASSEEVLEDVYVLPEVEVLSNPSVSVDKSRLPIVDPVKFYQKNLAQDWRQLFRSEKS